MIYFQNLTLVGLLLLNVSCNDDDQKADLIIINAKIWTGNVDQPSVEAMAIRGETILALGSNKDIQGLDGDSTQIINLNGKLVTPGFIDCHVHFLTGGFNLSSVQLRDAKTPEDFIQRIAEFAKTMEPGTWILGGDWDHEQWGGRLPERAWIDEVTEEHPVFLNRLDGHMALANSLAMELAGINAQVEDVEGGTLVRDGRGTLTGIFKDNAMALVGDNIPPPSSKQVDRALTNAMKYVSAQGVTSVHHMTGYMDALERARQKNNLITRIYATMALENWQELKEKIDKEGDGDHWLKIGGLKGFIDGSLGSHTAAFNLPYTDIPTDKGFFVHSKKDLYSWISNADRAKLQVMVHAIGDSAIHFLLNTFEQVSNENGPRDRRFRIEHAQHIARADISRFAVLGVYPSMQPYHAIDDGRWAEKAIGPERIKTTYAFKSLMDAGANVIFGSDWFVAPPTPLVGIYAAVTRRTLDDKNPNGWVPEQKISVEDALSAYTKIAAYASFEEDIKGTLEPGKLADFIVLSEDITSIDPVKIREVQILQTYVGGEKVYEKTEK